MAELLVLDNDARIVELVALFLQRAGHEVRCATSFREARARIQERRPELLLSDLELGRESGRVELPALWRDGLLPPTLVVSGYIDAELERELSAVPAVVGTLAKPFDFAQLPHVVLDALERARERGPAIDEARRRVLATPRVAAVSAPDDEGWIEILPPGAGA